MRKSFSISNNSIESCKLEINVIDASAATLFSELRGLEL